VPVSTNNHCFITFENSLNDIELPQSFTFPFFYTPHPLSISAAQQLQKMLNHEKLSTETGKMFGVLVVKNEQNELGFLCAYSGQSTVLSKRAYFVPSLSQNTENSAEFLTEQAAINQITIQLKTLTSNPKIQELKITIKEMEQSFTNDVTKMQISMASTRKSRKEQRSVAESILDKPNLEELYKKLSQQSIDEKNAYKELKRIGRKRIGQTQNEFNILETEINATKAQRKSRSFALQQSLFQQYQLLNAEGNSKPLLTVFKDTPQGIPPSGAGDCAAPKLLQFAFQNNLQPISMAEFWWGEAPKSEIRQHKNYYPACIGKCEPILNWMMEGLDVDENPLLSNPGHNKTIEIIYQDDAIAIINKPHGLLSVSGKHIQDSVQTRMKQLFPHATGPLIVHRLDMPTSGLMVIALSKRANKALQKQFIHRGIKKRYVALIDGKPNASTGSINLPLRGDFLDRPRQIVCEIDGKQAETDWVVVSPNKSNQTKVYLSPKTGRTHQLRVHCAHSQGLNSPIIGDELYGKSNKRLYLHAETLTLEHPITKEIMTFQAKEDF